MAWPVLVIVVVCGGWKTPPLVGLLEPLAAGGAQGPSAAVLFVVGGDVSDSFVGTLSGGRPWGRSSAPDGCAAQ